MSESYTPADLLQKVDAIRCNVEGILRVIHPIEHAQQEVERLRQKFGNEFKLIDHPENYLEPEDWATLLKKTLVFFEDVKERVTKIGHIMALKCKQHARKILFKDSYSIISKGLSAFPSMNKLNSGEK